MDLKILIIDDHRLFREGLQSLLQRRNIDVVAAVGDGNAVSYTHLRAHETDS